MDANRCYVCGRTADQVQAVIQPFIDQPRNSEIGKINELSRRIGEELAAIEARHEAALRVLSLAPDLLRTEVSTFLAQLDRMKSMYVGTDVVSHLIELTAQSQAGDSDGETRRPGSRSKSSVTIQTIANSVVREHESTLSSQASIEQRRHKAQEEFGTDEVQWIRLVGINLQDHGANVSQLAQVPLCLVCSSWKHEIEKFSRSFSQGLW